MAFLSRQLLSLLQLTRMALVFTAIADSMASLWLLWSVGGHSFTPATRSAQIAVMFVVAIISAGLYGFGMSLNDIIDRRRDQQLAAHRPLPSGRIGLGTAHGICLGLAVAALAAGFFYAVWTQPARGWALANLSWPERWISLVLVVWTGLLITFYDYAGKYLVTLGLLTLGMIRFFHATIPAPQLPLLWHPLLLLNHVTLLSTIAYAWEDKRPALTRGHWWSVISGLVLADAILIGAVLWRRNPRTGGDWMQSLSIGPGLLLPGLCVLAFIGIAMLIRITTPNRRDAGQKLMLYGLLWLIVYDAAFVASYVGLAQAGLIFLLLPVAYLSVQLMRWWSKIMSLSQKPEFKRAGM